MDISLAISDEDIVEAATLLLQLRVQFNPEEIISKIKRQMKNGYQVALIREDEKVVGATGFVVAEKLAWGKHIYVDDLITSESHRSSGVGHALINWLKVYGLSQGCGQLHLDSGVQRFPAHKFYLREGFVIASHHFSITDLS